MVPRLASHIRCRSRTRDVEDFGFTPQDNYNRAAEKAPASNDRRHQLVTNVGLGDADGFQMVGCLRRRGRRLPFNVTTGVDSNRDAQTTTDRPDLANPDGDPRALSTYNANFTGRVGNLSRNYGRGDPYFEAHLRFSKFVNLSSMTLDRLELFVEALNITNYVNLGTPTGNLRSAPLRTIDRPQR